MKRLLLLGLLLLASLAEVPFHRDFMDASCRVSSFFQSFGAVATVPSHLLSTVFTFWIPGLLFGYNHASNNSVDSFYHTFKYFAAVTLGVYFKALFYQGRPYLICEDIAGCTCDPGMPSGHAIMAVIGYFSLYELLAPRWPGLGAKLLTGLTALAIVVSRSVLGAHSLDQLAIGTLIALSVAAVLDKRAFERVFAFLSVRPQAYATLLFIFNGLFGLAFLLLNHEFREDRTLWKHFHKCPKCKDTLVVSQTLNMSVCQLLPGFIAQYPYRLKHRVDTYKLFEQRGKRLWLYGLFVLLPPLCVFGLAQLLVTTAFSTVYQASVVTLGLVMPAAAFVGYMMSRGIFVVYEKHQANDMIHDGAQGLIDGEPA